MFGVFVMACGTTHIFSIWNIWEPYYWADAGVKALTATVSLVTAILLWPLIPRALSIPSQELLRRTNQELQNEMIRRDQAERELREINQILADRSAELEAVNRELEAFSYSVAHDLRAPLRHIGGFSNMLLADSENLTDTDRYRLNAIALSATRMGKLIDDLLTLSRMSRLEFREQAVDLNAVVRAAHTECLPAAGSGAIDWRLSTLPAVRGDATLLQVVFTNLLSNAVKFSRGRDQPIIQIDTQVGDGEEVIVVVKDNGVGFDPRYQSKLFGIFQRLHREDEFEGTGVGLATVRRIIERLGGRIWAESALDQGAFFFVALRRA
jgi:light-regulated signal transduction histidine kinase (bacteriophytochrome)